MSIVLTYNLLNQNCLEIHGKLLSSIKMAHPHIINNQSRKSKESYQKKISKSSLKLRRAATKHRRLCHPLDWRGDVP